MSRVIRYAGIATATFGYGALFGLWLLLYSMLRSRHALLNLAAGASLYVIAEQVAEFSVGGYYLPAFSHAVAALPWLMSFASLGGAALVSFIIALLNLFLADMLLALPAQRKYVLKSGGAAALFFAVIFLANTLYLHSGENPARMFSVAIIQIASPSQKTFASAGQGGTLLFPWLGGQIAAAAQGRARSHRVSRFAGLRHHLARYDVHSQCGCDAAEPSGSDDKRRAAEHSRYDMG